MAARELMDNAPDWARVTWMILWRAVSTNLMLSSSARPSRIPRTILSSSTSTLSGELGPEAPVDCRWPAASLNVPPCTRPSRMRAVPRAQAHRTTTPPLHTS
jgi:hypothetical protein